MNNKAKISIVFILVVITIITCIHPIYPKEQLLQHLGTVLLVLPMLWDIKNKVLNKFSFIGLSLFTLLHIIGARYIYSYVPYDEVIKQLFGLRINEILGTTRNHYDRLVHFSFGLLLLPMVGQLVERRMKCGVKTAIIIAWFIIQTGSMLYELFEWLLTIVMTTEAANNYNGQQGDMWDAQKDMAIALIGSTITAWLLITTSRNAKKLLSNG